MGSVTLPAWASACCLGLSCLWKWDLLGAMQAPWPQSPKSSIFSVASSGGCSLRTVSICFSSQFQRESRLRVRWGVGANVDWYGTKGISACPLSLYACLMERVLWDPGYSCSVSWAASQGFRAFKEHFITAETLLIAWCPQCATKDGWNII